MNLTNSRTYISLSTSLLTIKHTWKLRWVFFLASTSTLLSIPIIIKDGFGVGPAIGVGAFGFIVSIASIVVELRNIKANNDRLLFVPSPIFDHQSAWSTQVDCANLRRIKRRIGRGENCRLVCVGALLHRFDRRPLCRYQ